VLKYEPTLQISEELVRPELRELLSKKLYPPIFDSWADFRKFAAPLVASGVFVFPFVYGPANEHAYVMQRGVNLTSTR
jgi:hypothetical protein